VTTGLRVVFLVLVVGSTIGCDRVTKHMATTLLADKPAQAFLADSVRLVYAENTGGFLSLGAELPPVVRTSFFTLATGLVLAVLLVMLFRSRGSFWPPLGLALFVAGGVSNWIDRVLTGRVVDFLNVGVGPLRTGIFNVADMAIMLGIALFVLGELATRRRPES
jgi:signal peptidase II